MKCQDCNDGIRRYLDRPTGLWLHDVDIDGGRAVCNDQCYVDHLSSRMCVLGTRWCAVDGIDGHGG
jgi:hypothetical protein